MFAVDEDLFETKSEEKDLFPDFNPPTTQQTEKNSQ